MRLIVSALALFLACSAVGRAGDIRVDVDVAHPLASFRPLEALGSTVDKQPAGSIPRVYSRRNVHAMLDAGAGWLSYRLFTELSSQDWHWNPRGAFSGGTQGYWRSSSSLASAPIADSFGYRLPHRGTTSDQGSNEGYSRLDDGDAGTYWKSNPYLSSAFTGESDAAHAQWVIVDLGAARPVNALRIAWGAPYAKHYDVAYWTGADAIQDPGHVAWRPFARAAFLGRAGTETVRLGAVPRAVRFVRLRMTASSRTCDSHGSGDRRNCVGYAIRELSAGTLDARGAFHDLVLHARCGGERPGRYACGLRQTAMYVSSVDPWHSVADRVRNQELPGLDLIARSGLTRGLGAMYPVPLLYSTPGNAVAEIRYLAARRYKIAYVELGEEPDGQYITPEDYGALYVQWARALHAFDPSLKLGGPVFSGVNSELETWPDARGNVSWLNRFLQYLRSHGALGELAFLSFEHYPFDGCEHGKALRRDLLQEPAILRTIVHTWRADGVPPSVPLFITEANFSAVNFTQTPMQIEGALWLADYMAGALSDGVARVVYYQAEPVPLSQNKQCASDWGNLTMFVADERGTIRARAAQFYAMQVISQRWLQPGNGMHRLYPAQSILQGAVDPALSAYAVRRPDGRWSLLLVNKDARAREVTVRFRSAGGARVSSFAGAVRRVTFGSAQYAWRARGAASRPSPNDPPAVDSVTAGAGAAYRVPAQSLTVLQGSIEGSR